MPTSDQNVYRDVEFIEVIKTAAMECGTKYEPDAAKLYFDTNMLKLYKSGFLINPSVSWIAPQCTQE